MERIQSAIEKARARRQEGQPAPGQAEAQAEVLHLPEISAQDAWQAIPEFVPKEKTLQRHRIFTLDGGASATPFDMMRTKVLQQMRANNWRRLGITSPSRGCGKTTLAANLAFSLARQADIRTALIEMDMRRPALARTLGLGRGRQQFSTVLQGASPAFGHMLRYGSNLAFGICRTPVHNPSELLQSKTAQSALEEIERQLDLTLTIFDMPPMLVSDDMLAFVGHVDCVLLVSAAENSTIKEVDICEHDLAERTNVLGIVLNKCRHTDSGHGYGYYG